MWPPPTKKTDKPKSRSRRKAKPATIVRARMAPLRQNLKVIRAQKQRTCEHNQDFKSG